MMKKLILAIAFSFAVSAHAQAWQNILPSTRAIDWTLAGVPGGIPSASWPIAAAVRPAASGDSTSLIQNALNACGTNRVVMLAAGTYNVTRLHIPPHCVLRGTGADKTILNGTLITNAISIALVTTGGGTMHQSVVTDGAYAMIELGNFGNDTHAPLTGSWSPNYSNAVNVVSGNAQGSTTINLSSTTGISPGMFLQVDQVNDGTLVMVHGNNGDCSWCGRQDAQGNLRSQGQIVRVTAVTGDAVTFFPALMVSYTLTPQATPFQMDSNAGIENLQTYANWTGYGANIYMTDCYQCWVSGVEGNWADAAHMVIDYSFQSEVVNSYFSNGYLHIPGQGDNTLLLRFWDTYVLVQNNILERLHPGILYEWGVAGNVIAYNFITGGFQALAPASSQQGINAHGAHPQFNLFEGNISEAIGMDNTWGSQANETWFRNWATGTDVTCQPVFVDTSKPGSRATPISCTPFGGYYAGANSWLHFQNATAVELDASTFYSNLIGNVVGSLQQENVQWGEGDKLSVPLPVIGQVNYPTYRSYEGNVFGYAFGYFSTSDDGSSGSGSSLPYSTLFWHGDWNDLTKSVPRWESGATHTLPASFYLSGKPSWWTPGIPWPAIGPDVTSGSGASGRANLIPAATCYYKVMGGTQGGAGSPYVFNADACYKAASSSFLKNISFHGMMYK